MIQLHTTNAQYLDTKEAQIPQIDMPPIGQNIGLDTEYNSNWDSPEIFPSVYAIASDDEGITPLTVAAGTAVMVMLVKIMQLTITLAIPKSSCLLCL